MNNVTNSLNSAYFEKPFATRQVNLNEFDISSTTSTVTSDDTNHYHSPKPQNLKPIRPIINLKLPAHACFKPIQVESSSSSNTTFSEQNSNFSSSSSEDFENNESSPTSLVSNLCFSNSQEIPETPPSTPRLLFRRSISFLNYKQLTSTSESKSCETIQETDDSSSEYTLGDNRSISAPDFGKQKEKDGILKGRLSPIQNLDLIKKNKTKSFDNKLFKHMFTVLQRDQNPYLQPIEVEKWIKKFSEELLDRLIGKEEDLLKLKEKNYLQTEAERFLELVQKNEKLLQPIIAKIKVAQDALQQFCIQKKQKSSEAINLSQCLELLVAVRNERVPKKKPIKEKTKKDVRVFTNILDTECKSDFSQKIVNFALGRTKNEIESVKAFLHKWSKEEACEQILTIISKAFQSHVEISKLLRQRFEWSSLIINKYNCFNNFINLISIEEVERCILANTKVIFDKILINNVELKCKIDEVDSLKCKRKFFKILLEAIYAAGFNASQRDPAIEDQLTEFLAHRNFEAAEILKLCTNSSWPDMYIRQSFPNLFNSGSSILTRAKQGIECYFNIESSGNYSVTQVKKYVTYPKVNPGDPSSFAIDEKKPLCTFTFSSTVYHYATMPTYTGFLQIPQIEIDPNASHEEKWLVFNALLGKN